MVNMTALFYDLETNGLPSAGFKPEIVQVGAILQDLATGQILQELNLMCKVQGDMPDVCVQLHGITTEQSQKHGLELSIADNLFALLAAQADVIVSHNLFEFDLPVLQGVWPVSGAIVATKPKFCTMQAMAPIKDVPRRHAGKSQYVKLVDAYNYFYEKDFVGAHNALIDTKACQAVFKAQLDDGWYTILEDKAIVPTEKSVLAQAGA